MDVLEIDGASNNGVEQVRELRETVKYAPATARFKIYIIDEVHMLSTAAFNALLKTLEEPPAHVKFMFATTEPEKVLSDHPLALPAFRPPPDPPESDHPTHRFHRPTGAGEGGRQRAARHRPRGRRLHARRRIHPGPAHQLLRK